MSKDLFDESTMTFGEHLEALRFHLFRALIGLVIAVCIAFFISKDVLLIIQAPVSAAMKRYFQEPEDAQALKEAPTAWKQVEAWWRGTKALPEEADKAKLENGVVVTEKTVPQPNVAVPPSTGTERDNTTAAKTEAEVPDADLRPSLTLQVDAREFAAGLHAAFPDTYAAPPVGAEPKFITLQLTRKSHLQVVELINAQSSQVRTDSVDEAFMVYLKISLLVGVLIASPYIFYQLWLFIGAGLYPHEQKYVYIYLPLSLFLFLGGCAFAFFFVIPTVLDFLFGFNKWMDLRPEMKISSWLSFVTIVPLMFGVSFQLPIVMVFLQKINILTVDIYRTYRRHAILAIAVISMIFTPSDPVSMLMMMVPLTILYEIGILLCGRKSVAKSPFEVATVK